MRYSMSLRRERNIIPPDIYASVIAKCSHPAIRKILDLSKHYQLLPVPEILMKITGCLKSDRFAKPEKPALAKFVPVRLRFASP